jgi:hypothetical protein
VKTPIPHSKGAKRLAKASKALTEAYNAAFGDLASDHDRDETCFASAATGALLAVEWEEP